MNSSFKKPLVYCNYLVVFTPEARTSGSYEDSSHITEPFTSSHWREVLPLSTAVLHSSIQADAPLTTRTVHRLTFQCTVTWVILVGLRGNHLWRKQIVIIWLALEGGQDELKSCDLIGYPNGRNWAIVPAWDCSLCPEKRRSLYEVINSFWAIFVRPRHLDIGLVFYVDFYCVAEERVLLISCFIIRLRQPQWVNH